MTDYIAFMHKEPSSCYGISFPDFLGCIAAADTLEDAKEKAKQALEFHIEGMIEDGEDIPKPSPLDDVIRNPDFKDAIALVISVDEPIKTVRVNITLRKDHLEEIDKKAQEAGLNRSAYLVSRSLDNG